MRPRRIEPALGEPETGALGFGAGSIIGLALGAAGLGFLSLLLLGRRRAQTGRLISYDVPVPARTPVLAPAPALAPAPPEGGAYVATTTIPKELSPAIIASARKWAKVRGIPLQEVLATILVESTGYARAWACLPGPKSGAPGTCTKENSYGLMQVNVNVWMPLLKANGMVPTDLYDIDKAIQIGTLVYAKYRKEVQNLIAQAGVKQTMPLGTITRLYYKGPKFVRDAILAGRVLGTTPKTRPYKQTAEAVARWDKAMSKTSAVV